MRDSLPPIKAPFLGHSKLRCIPIKGIQSQTMAKNHNKYRKDKPWDNEEIDHWKIEEFKPEEVTGTFLEESSFATLFPKYREKYLREVWPVVTRTLEVTSL